MTDDAKFAPQALTFDDVLLLPAHSAVLPAEADTSLPGTTLYALSAYPGLKFRVDETAQTLAVDAPAKLFNSVQVSGSTSGYVPAPPAPAAPATDPRLPDQRGSGGAPRLCGARLLAEKVP